MSDTSGKVVLRMPLSYRKHQGDLHSNSLSLLSIDQKRLSVHGRTMACLQDNQFQGRKGWESLVLYVKCVVWILHTKTWIQAKIRSSNKQYSNISKNTKMTLKKYIWWLMLIIEGLKISITNISSPDLFLCNKYYIFWEGSFKRTMAFIYVYTQNKTCHTFSLM